MMASTRVVLLRHGESEDNVAGVAAGWRDGGLTSRGLEQAALAARHIAVVYQPEVIYTSPLRRARQTAEPLSQLSGLPLIEHEHLRELSLGAIEGLTLEQITDLYQEHQLRSQDDEDLEFVWPGGERRRDFYARVRRVVDEIVERHTNQTVAVVTHAGALSSLLAELLEGTPTRWRKFQLANCGISELEVRRRELAVVRWNDTSHLDTVAET
jgi:broad specificity phosphatase PhoE